MHPAYTRYSIMHPTTFASLIGLQQIVCWGTLTYAASVFAPSIAQACGISIAQVMTTYAIGLLTNAAVAPLCTRWVLRVGAFVPACLGLGLMLLACAVLSQASHVAILLCGFMIAGLAMALTQYDFAFLTVSLYMPLQARRVITLITFYGALASSIMWPSAVWLAAHLGTSHAWLALGLISLIVSLPAVVLAYRLPIAPQAPHALDAAHLAPARADRASPGRVVLGLIGLAILGTSIVANLPMVLNMMQTPPAHTAWILSLFGIGQLAARALDYAAGRWFSIRATIVACSSSMLIALALMLLVREQVLACAVFSFVLGAANGLTTILRGVVPQQLFHGQAFATISALLASYGALGRAVAPVLAAYALAMASGLQAMAIIYALVTLLCAALLWQQMTHVPH